MMTPYTSKTPYPTIKWRHMKRIEMPVWDNDQSAMMAKIRTLAVFKEVKKSAHSYNARPRRVTFRAFVEATRNKATIRDFDSHNLWPAYESAR